MIVIFIYLNKSFESGAYNIGDIKEGERVFADLMTVFVEGNSLTVALGEEIILMGLFTDGNSFTNAFIGVESGTGGLVGGESLTKETAIFGCKRIGSLFNARLIKACRPAR